MAHSFNQHFVQKRLLSNFTSTPNSEYKKQKIWVYNKETKKSTNPNIRKVAFKANFLRKNADDAITLIERECNPIIERIIDKECVICRHFNDKEQVENYTLLYRYIITQLYRTPHQRKLLKTLPYWKDKEEREIKDWQSSYFTDHDPFFLDFDFARSENQIKGHLAQIYLYSLKKVSKIPPIRIDGIVSSVYDVTIPIVVVNETEIPYIINDAGLVPSFPLNFDVKNLVMITGEKTNLVSFIAFPIRPNICINLCTIKSISEWVGKIPENTDRGLILETKETQSVKLINKLSYAYADRFVYSNQPLDNTLLI